ncbi:MAG: glycoprotein [Cytophagaceae bacterium]
MRIIYIVFLTFILNTVWGQTVALPDNNLRDKLIASYPQVMQGNLLDISKAALLTGSLDLRFSNIVDASGIEYFKSIITLDLSNNQLTTIPDISGITGLINFYANNNNLTSLPDMSLLHLSDFQVVNNKLTALPNLSGSTNLSYIFCSNNNLTAFPPISQYPTLKKLVCGQNPIATNFIDVSNNLNLTELHVHRTGIDTIIGLNKLTNLTTIYAWSNNIKSFKGLDLITPLNICVIYDNPFTELPNMQNKTSLNTLIIHTALLTFEDLQPVLQNPPTTFIYAPQRLMPFPDIFPRAENDISISYPVDSPLSSNMYVWRKNGVVIDSSSSPTLTFHPIKITDTGTYQLKVYNPYIPNIRIESTEFKIKVLPCIEIDIPSTLDIISKDCSKGYKIDFSQNIISGGTPPYSFVLVTNTTQKNITYPLVENLEAGNYQLKIIDSKFCSATDKFTLNKIDHCDPVITPNGDGVMDSYYIERNVKYSVYNIQRELVNTIQGPIVWDGTDRNGVLLDAGLYVLITEGEKPIYLTIIR